MSQIERCSDCPPVGYSTDRTRCVSCDRSAHEQLSRAFGEAEADKIIDDYRHSPNPKNTGKQTMPEGKSEIPADVLSAAEEALDNMLCNCREAFDSDNGQRNAMISDIAQAILAERERCAQLANDEADKLKLRDGPDKRRDPLNKQLVAMKVVCRDIAASIRGVLT